MRRTTYEVLNAKNFGEPCYSQLEDYPDLQRVAELALLAEPEDPYLRFQRGVSLIGQASFTKAIEAFDEVLRLDPQHALTYNLRGVAYENLGNHEAAQADYAQAEAIDPSLHEPDEDEDKCRSEAGRTRRSAFRRRNRKRRCLGCLRM